MAILIYKNLMKGYFAHKSKVVVLSKQDPFPKLNGKPVNAQVIILLQEDITSMHVADSDGTIYPGFPCICVEKQTRQHNVSFICLWRDPYYVSYLTWAKYRIFQILGTNLILYGRLFCLYLCSTLHHLLIMKQGYDVKEAYQVTSIVPRILNTIGAWQECQWTSNYSVI